MDYDDMLDRAIDESPDVDGSGDRFEVPSAEIRQEGNATVFENFRSVCDAFGRDDDHVMKFLQRELGTNGHIDERGRARLTGSFNQRRVDDAVHQYADTYVVCPECGLPDTRIEREDGVALLRCEACGARSSIDR